MKAAEKQRLQKRMAELRSDRDRLAELLELKDRQLAECRAEANHYEHRVSLTDILFLQWYIIIFAPILNTSISI